MPTYVLQCTDCKEKFSMLVSMRERENIICPKCGSKQLKQDYSSVFIGGKSSTSNGGCGGSGRFT